MPTQSKRIVQTVVGISLAVLFLFLTFRTTNWSELWGSLSQVNLLWVGVLIPVGLASHWIRAVRWRYLLMPIKQTISTRNLFSAVMIGYMVNNIVPRLGELVRPYVVGKLEGISKSSAFGSVVAERIIDMISFFFIVCLVFFVYPNSLDPFVDDPSLFRPLFFAGSFVAIGLFTLLFVKINVVTRFVQLLRPVLPSQYYPRVERIVESFLSGFAIAKTPKAFGPLAATSFLLWIVYALGLYIAFFAFDAIADRNLGYGAAVLLLAVSAVAFILPAPGAFGTYHSFLTIALVKIYSIDGVTALSYTILTHELGYLVMMIGGIYFFLRDNFKVAEVRMQLAEGGTA